MSLGERFTGIAALGDRIFVDTPDHPRYSFARYDPDGKLVGRFGTRLSAPHPGLVPAYNEWVVVAHGRLGILAGHRHRPILRRFSPDGALVWDQEVQTPVARERERLRALDESQIQELSSGTCVRCRLFSFTADLEPNETGFGFRLAGSRVLDWFDENGRWRSSSTLIANTHSAPSRAPEVAEVALLGSVILARESGELRIYRPSDLVRREGVVVSAGGQPIGLATVDIELGAEPLRAKTDDAGTFELLTPAGNPEAAVRVSAAGYYDLELDGPLDWLLRNPLVLHPAKPLCVVVLDGRTEQPVPRFEIAGFRHASSTDHASVESGPRETFQSPEGRGCLDLPWPPPWLAHVLATGYARETVHLEAEDTIRVRLVPEAHVLVETTDDRGEPVSDAVARVEPAHLPEREVWVGADEDSYGTTEESGRVQLRRLKPGTYRVRIDHPDYLAWSETRELEEGPNEIAVELDGGGAVNVLVTTRDGNPVPEARVTVARKECRTSLEGACRVSGLALGRVPVAASADGFAAAHSLVFLTPSATDQTARLELGRSVSLTGQLGGVEAFPTSRFRIRVSAPGSPWVETPVAPDGGFVFREVPCGTVTFEVVDQAGLRYSLDHASLDCAETEHWIDLALPTPLQVTGRVTRSGEVCTTCSVAFRRLTAEIGTQVVQTTTDGQGAYALLLPVAGRYFADVVSHDGTSAASEELIVEHDLYRDFELGGAVLEGAVTVSTGSPEGAAVRVVRAARRLAETMVGALGDFRFEGLPPGEVEVVATLGGLTASKPVRLENDAATRLELRLEDRGVVQLRLVDSLTGLPLPSARVSILYADREFRPPSSILAGPDGTIVVPVERPEPVVLAVQPAGYALVTLRGVAPGSSAVPVAFHPMPKHFSVEVSRAAPEPCALEVRDATGLPIALTIELPPGPASFRTREPTLFHGLAPGAYTAILHACSGEVIQQPLQLELGTFGRIVF